MIGTDQHAAPKGPLSRSSNSNSDHRKAANGSQLNKPDANS